MRGERRLAEKKVLEQLKNLKDQHKNDEMEELRQRLDMEVHKAKND